MKNVIAMTTSELALLLTAYESCGSVGYHEFVKMLCDEITVDDEMLSEYMSYLAENGYEYYYSDLDEMLCGMNPTEVAKAVYFGDIKSWNDDYFYFNGYGNIASISEYELKKQCANDNDFMQWYITENMLDDFDVDEIVSECNELVKEGY